MLRLRKLLLEFFKEALSNKPIQTKTFIPPILGIIAVLVIHPPLHEFGHWLIATMDGAQIINVVWFPYIDEIGFHNPYIKVNESTFSSIQMIVLFLSAGLIVTFIPYFLLFIYLHNRRSSWWTFTFVLIMLSPVETSYDLLKIGNILQNPSLGMALFLLSLYISLGLIIYFIFKIRVLVWLGQKVNQFIKTHNSLSSI